MRQVQTTLVCLLMLVAAAGLARAADVVVYSNSFDSAVGPEWSLTNTDVTPIGNIPFLGQYDNESAVLTLSNLPAHASLTVSFDLYIIGSWDGHGSGPGPDIWDLTVAGGTNLLHTTFSNVPNCSPGDRDQDFPGMYPGSDFVQRTGCVASNSLGFHFIYGFCGQTFDAGDTTYHLTYTMADSSPAISLAFSSSQVDPGTDERWGLNHVVISASVVTTVGCTVDDLCPCEGPVSGGGWKSHRDYLRCISTVSAGFVQAGAMTPADRTKALVTANHSRCGW